MGIEVDWGRLGGLTSQVRLMGLLVMDEGPEMMIDGLLWLTTPQPLARA
jgi:hypothetical protein